MSHSELFISGKPLACLFHMWIATAHVSCSSSPVLPTLATFADIPFASSGPISGCEENSLANWLAISFPSIPICPSTHTSRTLLCSASFTGENSCLNSQGMTRLMPFLGGSWVHRHQTHNLNTVFVHVLLVKKSENLFLKFFHYLVLEICTKTWLLVNSVYLVFLCYMICFGAPFQLLLLLFLIHIISVCIFMVSILTTLIQWHESYIFYLKLSPCSECCTLSSG